MHDHGFDLDGFLDKLKEAVENVTKSEKGASKTTKAVFDIASAIHQYKTGEPSEMPKGLESALETGDKISEGAEKWLKFYGSAKAIFDAKDKFNGDEADLLSAVGGLLGNAGSYLPAPLDKLADQYAQLIKAIGGALDGIKNSEEAGERNLEAYGEGYGAAADNQYLGPEWGLGQLRKNGMDAIADALKEQSKCDCGKRSWN